MRRHRRADDPPPFRRVLVARPLLVDAAAAGVVRKLSTDPFTVRGNTLGPGLGNPFGPGPRGMPHRPGAIHPVPGPHVNGTIGPSSQIGAEAHCRWPRRST